METKWVIEHIKMDEEFIYITCRFYDGRQNFKIILTKAEYVLFGQPLTGNTIKVTLEDGGTFVLSGLES